MPARLLAERRAHQHVHQHHRHGEEREHQIEERHLVRQIEAEIRPAAEIDAVVAAGERIPAIGQAPDALAERERDHQEIDAAGADGEQSEHRRQRRADQNAEHDHQPEIPAQAEMEFGGEHRGEIGADAEIGRLPHRGHAGVAEQEVDAHGEDGEGHRARRQQDDERAGVRNDIGERHQRGGDHQDFDLLADHRASLTLVRTGRSA